MDLFSTFCAEDGLPVILLLVAVYTDAVLFGSVVSRPAFFVHTGFVLGVLAFLSVASLLAYRLCALI